MTCRVSSQGDTGQTKVSQVSMRSICSHHEYGSELHMNMVGQKQQLSKDLPEVLVDS